MTSDPQKTVFISYRRSTSKGYARAIFDRLHNAGYNVFLDVNTIDSGAFDEIILRQIAARAHFIVLISRGSLKRCQNDDDWLRREIEQAMSLTRNVIPLIEDDVNFKRETEYLPVNIRDAFRKYNSVGLSHEYFDAAIDKLTTRFFKDPVAHVKLGQPSIIERKEVEQRIEQVISDLESAIIDYTEIIHLNPQNKLGYIGRGDAHNRKGDYNHAIVDFSQAIRLDPQDELGYLGRGDARYKKHDYEGAIADFTELIRLNPDNELGYLARAGARKDTGDLDGAIADYIEAIRINPHNELAFIGRRIVTQDQKRLNR